MIITTLKNQTCAPFSDGGPTLESEKITPLLNKLPNWKVVDVHHLQRSLTFGDFTSDLAWLNRAGVLCEDDSRHGFFSVGWGYLETNIHTKKARGFTRDDTALTTGPDAICTQLSNG